MTTAVLPARENNSREFILCVEREKKIGRGRKQKKRRIESLIRVGLKKMRNPWTSRSSYYAQFDRTRLSKKKRVMHTSCVSKVTIGRIVSPWPFISDTQAEGELFLLLYARRAARFAHRVILLFKTCKQHNNRGIDQ